MAILFGKRSVRRAWKRRLQLDRVLQTFDRHKLVYPRATARCAIWVTDCVEAIGPMLGREKPTITAHPEQRRRVCNHKCIVSTNQK